MAATARVTVLFEPAEKTALQTHAAAARISTGEYIKRAVSAYDADAEAELSPAAMSQFEAYAGLIESATKMMSEQIDASVARIDHALDPAREVEMRARIEQEVRGMDLSGVAALFGHRA